MAIALLAGLRVFAFAAAFPPFHGVDEHLHYDAVLKYAEGLLPGRGPSPLARETVETIVEAASPEYRAPASEQPFGRVLTAEEKRRDFPLGSAPAQRAVERLERQVNLQFWGPPLYYASAAAWYRLGRGLGLGRLQCVYFVKWLNVVASVALVGLAYAFLRRRFPEDALLRLGVPLLLAILPNDLCYGVSNDVPSPLLGAACFALLVRLAEEPRPALRLHVGAGLLLAAACLSKYSNAFLFSAAAVACLLALRRAGARGRTLRAWATLALAALLPICAWLLRNELVVGSSSGQQRKVELLGWSAKPLAEWLDHPLFSPAGLYTFLRWLFALLWRGEIGWAGEPMRILALDRLYAWSSLGLLGLAAGAWLLRRRVPGRPERAARPALETLALAAVAGAVLQLAILSLGFDFGTATRTSRQFPYLVSGRLVAGCLLPFCLLYLRGLQVLCSPLPARVARVAAWSALVAVAIAASAGEIALTLPVFASTYNWYHAG